MQKRQQIDLVASINQLGAGQSNDSITDTIKDNQVYNRRLKGLFPFYLKKLKKTINRHSPLKKLFNSTTRA